jgi:putative hydrolase of the HAD superfamily
MAKEISTPETKDARPTIALLFELENLGFQGRKVVFDVLKSVLADKSMQLTPVLFSRFCVNTPVETALPRLLDALGHPRVSAERLVPDIVQGIRASMTDNTPKPTPAMVSLLKKAVEKGYSIGAVSDMDYDAASVVFAKLDIGEPEEGALITVESETGTGDALSWRCAARALEAVIPSCMALVSSSRAAHAAVAAGMRCVAFPDHYTAFQDFGGVDRIIDTLDDAAVSGVLDLLAVRS